MNKYQFRAIRNSFLRDRVPYYSKVLNLPIMGKKIEDVRVHGKPLTKFYFKLEYRLTKSYNEYKYYYVDYGSINTLHIITMNSRIIYFNIVSFTAPAHAAWRHLTEVYQGYGTGFRGGCWTWKSVDDFDCEMPYAEWRKKEFYKLLKDMHTPYQIKMFEETGGIYIDKKMASQQEIDECARKEYYHM
jgi:hypothetical protein